MTSRAMIFRTARLAIIAAAATTLSACWYYSRPTEGAAGESCQKTSYGLAMLDTSNENCQPPAAAPTAIPSDAVPPPTPAPQ